MADPPPYPGAPRWAKLSGIVVAVLILLAVVLMLAGGGAGRHGPGRHISSGAGGDQASSSGIAEERMQQP